MNWTMLSIVIVNRDTAKLLSSCLASIASSAMTFPIETCVVDNNSRDFSTQMVLERYSWVQVISLSVNVGYAAANNVGVKATSGRYLLFLNPDTELETDVLQKLVDYLELRPDVGAVGPKVLRPDGSLDKACRRSFPHPRVAFYRMVGLSLLFPRSKTFNRYNMGYLSPEEEADVDSLVGACMMVRRSVLRQIGGWDEGFFIYGEDIDLCYRAKLSGWKVRYFPEASILHHKGAYTSKDVLRFRIEFYRSIVRYYRKHYSQTSSSFGRRLMIYGILLFAILDIGARRVAIRRRGDAHWPGLAFAARRILDIEGSG